MSAHLIVLRKATVEGARRNSGWVESVCTEGDYVSSPSTSVGKVVAYGNQHANAKNKKEKV